MHLPPLETDRLLVRPFTMDDLAAIHQILDVELAADEGAPANGDVFAERQRWLEWTVMSYEELARLHQPPYGDRAIVLKESGGLIGACGLAPSLDAFGQLPAFQAADADRSRGYTSPEVGLYYAVSPTYQRQGYATEAARALIDYAFTQLKLRRIVATTTYDNDASMEVMRRLGMHVERNPYPDPPWLQVVGILENSPTRDSVPPS